MNTYEIDTLIEISVTFTDTAGVVVDPTTVTLFIQTPDGVTTAYTASSTPPIVHDSTGKFHLDVTTNQSGTWIYKWAGTGALEVTSPDTYFLVNPSADIPG